MSTPEPITETPQIVPGKACHSNCDKHCDKGGKSNPETLNELEAAFQKLAASDSKSLLKKYLTKDVFDSLKGKTTKFGSSLLDCIQSGKTWSNG